MKHGIEIDLPAVIDAQDYHDFEQMHALIKSLLNLNLHYIVLGIEHKQYHAVFFIERDQEVEDIIRDWDSGGDGSFTKN